MCNLGDVEGLFSRVLVIFSRVIEYVVLLLMNVMLKVGGVIIVIK